MIFWKNHALLPKAYNISHAKVGQHNHRQIVVRVSGIFCPGDTRMTNDTMAKFSTDSPSESIWVRTAGVEFDRRPHSGEARLFHGFPCGQRQIPFRRISDRSENSLMRRKLDRRDTSDIDELTIMEGISGRAILQNCPLIKDGSRFHSEGLEEPLSQKISIPPPAGLLDDHTEQEIPDVAVSPAISGTEVLRIFGRRLKQLSGGIVRPDATFPQSFETILQPGQSRC